MSNIAGAKQGLRGLIPWFVGLAAVWLFQLVAVDYIDPYYFTILMYAGVNVILAVSLNLVNGFTGQFSMGHAGFMSVGGYTSAFITTTLLASHPALVQPGIAGAPVFLISLLIGGLVAAGAGYLVGLPSLRLKGDYLAIVTLGFGEIIRVIVLNVNAVGGARGLPSIPQLTSFGWLFTWVLLTMFFMWRLVPTASGRAYLSVREDEIAAESMGVHTTRTKVRAFVIGAFFAGVAGGLFAHYLRYLNPQTFDFNRSFE
ncbi:MAG TPA: branched-chain amino acid ABC transporter permease, partial [Bdellovibrionota bacterium]|nr:branched-chain amino acid ABC transporter permease [Bdellovibrionota bacterium]